jgi:hypothetical protein
VAERGAPASRDRKGDPFNPHFTGLPKGVHVDGNCVRCGHEPTIHQHPPPAFIEEEGRYDLNPGDPLVDPAPEHDVVSGVIVARRTDSAIDEPDTGGIVLIQSLRRL